MVCVRETSSSFVDVKLQVNKINLSFWLLQNLQRVTMLKINQSMCMYVCICVRACMHTCECMYLRTLCVRIIDI